MQVHGNFYGTGCAQRVYDIYARVKQEATDLVDNFEKYVITKDKKTKNPLAKKSIGKAKKAIASTKKELGYLDMMAPTKTDLLKVAGEFYI